MSAVAVDTRLEPFTLEHFRLWAEGLVLDNGDPWVLEPFQEWFLEDLFSGVREVWLVVPEGNTKTTTLGGVALYHCEFRPLAMVPVAASAREQTEIMYRQAEGFVLRSPGLHEPVRSAIQAAKGKRKTEVPRFTCLEGYRRINHVGGGRIQFMAADDRTGDGVIPTLALLEELHRHRTLALYRTWRGKLLKRGGQLAVISTAGEPGGEFEEAREQIRQSASEADRDGSYSRFVSGGVVLHDWSVPEDGDVEDLRVVKAANPFSGITVDLLREKFEAPTFHMGHWRRFVCNLPTRSDNAAIQEKEWADAATGMEIPVGERVWAGLDVGWKWDTTALVPLWVRDDHFRLFGRAKVLVPPRDGSSLDPNLVEKALIDLHQRNPVDTLVMDMSRAEQLASWAEIELGCRVIDRSQSNAFAAADYEAFMEALRNGWLHHQGDRDLTRHALNAVARVLPYGDARFDRPAQTRNSAEQDLRVIDALSAAAMVHTVAAAEWSNSGILYDISDTA